MINVLKDTRKYVGNIYFEKYFKKFVTKLLQNALKCELVKVN